MTYSENDPYAKKRRRKNPRKTTARERAEKKEKRYERTVKALNAVVYVLEAICVCLLIYTIYMGARSW